MKREELMAALDEELRFQMGGASGVWVEALTHIFAAIEARGLVVEQGWLPIESAPRDGTTILGAEFLKGVGDWSYRQVAWGEGVDLMSDDEVRVFGWVDDVDGYVHPPPTHFIILAPPLPSPPASQEQQT